MIHDVFAFYDTKAALYSVPFFATNRSVGIRIATEVTSDPQTTIGRHPNDFVLFRLGAYDDNTGLLQPSQPEHLGVCSSFLEPARPAPLFDNEP